MSEATIGEQVAQAFDPAKDLDDLFWKLKRSRIRLASPAPRTRASSIGHPCERYVFYERTVPGEMRLLHSPELQAIFDLGNEAENYVLREIELMGAEIVQRGRDFADERYDLSGHVDAKIRTRSWPRSIPTEVKGLNPATATQIKTAADIRDHKQAWVRKYYSQLQAYLLLGGDELGLFALLNKSTGAIRFINCPIDYDHAEGVLKKAERIKLALVKNEPPPRTISDECARCAFLQVCGPDQQFGAGVSILEDPELPAMLERLEALREAADDFDDLDKEIKSRLPNKAGEFLAGDFAVIRTEQSRKAYVANVKATSFFKTAIRKLTK